MTRGEMIHFTSEENKQYLDMADNIDWDLYVLLIPL